MSQIVSILIVFIISTAPSYADELQSFGTGEVDASILQVGDRVEVTYRTVDTRSRSRMAEVVGLVTEVAVDVFVVDHPDGESVIQYEVVIRLDRTRSNAWTLDPLDLAMSQAALVEKYLEGRELEGLEGTWVWDDTSYEIAVIGNGAEVIPRYDYVGIVIATQVDGWQSGEVKLLLKETASEGTYSAVFVTTDKTRYGTTVQVSEGKVMEASFPRPRSRRTFTRLIHKTYPLPEPVDSSLVDAEPERPLTIGSGFFVTPTTIATANHLVDQSDTIIVKFDGRIIGATIRSRDQRNDIALLTVEAAQLRGSTIVPLSLGDPSDTLEGDRIVATGFASPTAPRPSVAVATVNSLFGPGDDLTRFTVSDFLGESAVGGPLIDTSNRVVAIALPTDTTGTVPAHTAAKSDLLSTLLRLSSLEPAASPDSSSSGIDATLIGQMARSAVVLIEAR